MRKFGIDLGTTNTCIYEAYYPIGATIEDFQLTPVTIRYKNTGDIISLPSENSMPSAIYGRVKADGDYEFYLGTVAVRMAARDSNPEIINTKRLLCKENPNQLLEYGLTAQSISQKLLEGCRYSIDRKYPNPRMLRNSHYCITQPAAFGLFASRSIQDAAIPAGFENPEPQREPIAALLSFLYDTINTDARSLFEKQKAHGDKLLTLVVDIGGGTTDVTIQEIHLRGSEDAIQGKSFCTGYCVEFLNQVRGDDESGPVATGNIEPAFGGLDFDRVIVEHVVDSWDKQFFDKFGRSFAWESREGNLKISSLYRRIQDFKNSLSESPNDIRYFEDHVTLEGETFTCRISSDEVYEWTAPLCQAPRGTSDRARTVYGIIADTIERSGYETKDIDYMFVTGGMSNFLPIRKMLRERFPQLEKNGVLHFSKTALEDIARGAAVCNSFFEVRMPQAVLYADLMIDDPCGPPRVLAKSNAALPVSNRIDNFMQLRNPVSLYVDVLWGQGANDSQLRRLRRLHKALPNHTIVPIGTKVSVNYTIDVHQAMDVELIVHAPDRDITVPLLNLIHDVDLSRGGEEDYEQ